ncbi:MAG: hypothetical protein AABY22_14890, partial [Nanoarchaeota archaeon]
GQTNVKEVDKTQQSTVDKNTQVGEKEGVKKDNSQETKKPVDIKAFDNLIGSNLGKEKVVLDKKEDDKKEETITEEKIGDIGIKLDENGNPIRDLEGFGEQEKKWLQRMPYEGYQYFSKVLKERKDAEVKYKTEKDVLTTKISNLEGGKQVLPESYYDNPNAFILSPEFGQIQQATNLSKTVETHWTEQLRKFKKGESWTPLVDDPKSGEILMDEDREFNADDEVYILKQLQAASNQTVKWSTQLERF